MGPHDYIIHKGKHELDIFMEDYKRLADKKQSLSTLIATYNMRNTKQRPLIFLILTFPLKCTKPAIIWKRWIFGSGK